MENNNQHKRFLASFATIGAGTIINMIIGFISTPIITRLIIPEEYGKLSIFTLYINIATMALCLGLDQALLRYFYKTEEHKYRKSLFFHCLLLPCTITVALSVAFYLLVRYNVIPFEFADINIVFLFGVIGELVNRFSLVLLRLTNKGKQYAVASIVYKLVFVCSAIAFAVMGHTTFGWLGVATVVAYFMSTLYAFFATKTYWGYQKNEGYFDYKKLITYGLPFILSSGLAVLFNSIDKLCLKYLSDYIEVGIYSSAITLIGVFSIVQTSFNTIWAPVMVEHYEKEPEDKKFFTLYNSIITFILFVFGLCFVMSKDVFGFLLGEKYRAAAFIIPFLSFHPIMYTVSETTVAGIVLKKKSYLHIVIALVSCIINLLGNFLLIPYLGGKGAAISTGLSYIVFYALRTFWGNRLYKFEHNPIKFWISTILLIGFAVYSTFYSTSIISFLIFVIDLVLVCFMYKDNIKIITNFIRQNFFIKNKQ